MFNFLKNISPIELLVIGLVLVILFGTRFVTGLGKTGGETFKEIKKIKRSFTEAIEDEPDKKGVSK